MPQNSQIWPKSKAIGLLFLPKSSIFNFLNILQLSSFSSTNQKCLKTAKFGQKVRLSACYFCQKLSIPISKNSSTNQKVPQNSQIWPKSKAIGLLFLPQIVHFQLSMNSSTNQRVPQNSHIWPKSKAIGLLFFPKIVHFQLSSTFFIFQHQSTSASKQPNLPKSKAIRLPIFAKNCPFQLVQILQQIKECLKTAKFGQKVRL